MSLVLLLSFLLLILIKVPVAFSLAISSTIALLYGGFSLQLIIQRMTNAVDSFILLAVPFFMLAGKLMEHGKISQKIIDFADSLVGFLVGGLAHVNIVTSMFFAGITGAAVADTSAIGSMLIPPMVKRGYDKDFSGAVTAASSVIGVIIPPSIPMVIFGVVTGTSVGRLFLGGFLPGILVGVLQIIISYAIAKKRGYPAGNPFSLKKILQEFKGSILALFMPIIILGGILLGIFTPTEAAVIAVIYALIISFFVYRTLHLKDIPKILKESAQTTSVVMLMVSAAFLYGWIISRDRVPVHLANYISELTVHPTMILILISIIYLIAGTLMDLGANIIILVPVLYPAVSLLGIDPVHFGLVTIIALSIGLITPPVGACLFVSTEIAQTSLLQISKAVLPYLVGLIITLLLLILFPQIVLWIPNTFM